MNNISTTHLLAGLAIVALGISLFRARSDRQHLNELRLRARTAIASVRVVSTDPRTALDGSIATIERIEETGGARGVVDKVADLSVTAYLRNGFGEKFLVKWHSKSSYQPFVKHLSGEPTESDRAS